MFNEVSLASTRISTKALASPAPRPRNGRSGVSVSPAPRSTAPASQPASHRREVDTAWANELAHRFEPAIRAGVRHVLISCGASSEDHLIPDLIQETYCRLLDDGGRRLASLQGASDLKCRRWLRRVAERVTLDHFRGRNCIKRGAGIYFDSVEPVVGRVADLRDCPEASLLQREELRDVVAACRRVTGSETNARLVALALCGGWSSGQLARLRGVSISQSGIDSLLSRSRHRLRRQGFSLQLQYVL